MAGPFTVYTQDRRDRFRADRPQAQVRADRGARATLRLERLIPPATQTR